LDSQSRLEEHRLYLERVVRAGEISHQLSDAARDILMDLLDIVGPDLEIPDAITGTDGKLFYTWKRDAHYLELEMRSDGTGEFFFRNSKSGDIWSKDFRLGQTLLLKESGRRRNGR
jgi:hypothetical protein